MAYRYTVLWEAARERAARPVGLVVQQDDHVMVEVPDDFCIPSRYDAPFMVAGPDMTTVRYTPEDAQYYDQVLMDLSRAFIVGETETLIVATEGIILGVFRDKILRPLRENHHEAYTVLPAHYPVVQRYRQQHYGDHPASTAHARERPAGATSLGGLVVA